MPERTLWSAECQAVLCPSYNDKKRDAQPLWGAAVPFTNTPCLQMAHVYLGSGCSLSLL